MGLLQRAGTSIELSVKQALLRSILADGTVVELVVLHDERCAILRDKKVEHLVEGDEAGIDDAVQRFTAMTQVQLSGGGGGAVAGAGGRAESAANPHAEPQPGGMRAIRTPEDEIAPPATPSAPRVMPPPPAAGRGTSA